MSRQRTYRWHERHEYNPGGCPGCGDTDPDIDWINVATHGDPDAWVPGLMTCTNEECPRR